YAQAEYTLLKKINLILSGSLNNTSYQRVDHFYYDKQHEKSKTYSFIGGTVKFGANYNIDRHNNVFANVGYISRAPFFSQGVFLSSAVSNAANPNPVNEKVFSAELGYGFSSRTFSAMVNAYYTKWLDKTTTRGGDITNGEHAGDRFYINMTGVNARHMGVELNFTYAPAKWFELTGMLSWGDYSWVNNPVGYFYNQSGEPLKDLSGNIADGILAENHAWAKLNQDKVKVGGSAQTTAAVGVTFKPFTGFRIGGDWKVAARNYSDYTISSSSFSANKEINLADPWEIPWGNQLDLNASYRFKLGDVEATLFGNVHNLFNYNYIVDATTPSDATGTWENAYGFYSFGRTYSMKLRINF
ncbi:MAG: TonB-dependent receptor, partial [Muribaculaceae bacterium]|nr:TonB-dependent receptor [Muribaculaceae bacterium]